MLKVFFYDMPLEICQFKFSQMLSSFSKIFFFKKKLSSLFFQYHDKSLVTPVFFGLPLV